MTSYLINQYQQYNFNYPNTSLGLYITPVLDNVGLTYNGLDYTFQVDVVNDPGVYEFFVYDSLDVLIDTIFLTVQKTPIDISFTKCITESIPLQALPPAPFGAWVLADDTYPSWLVLAFGYAVPSVNTVGTFYILFVDTLDPINSTYLVEFIFDSCLPTYDLCTPNRINITWLNISGGFSSYCFKGRKTYGVDVENKRTYKDSNNLRKYYNINGVYDTIEVLSGEVPISHLPFLKSLKYSVQVWIFRNAWIPIIIDNSNFTLYTDGDGLGRYDITVKYSKEILVQTQ